MSSFAPKNRNYAVSLPSSFAIRKFRYLLMEWWKTSRQNFPWRYSRSTKFHQIVSEVLLQRTKAETVAAFWPNFIDQFPNWKAIAATPVRELERFLKPIGLSKQRAPRLKKLALALEKKNGKFPKDRSQIEALSGVGQYIANAIEMFAHGRPRPLIDVNMARLLERYFEPRKLVDIRHDPYLQKLAQEICNTENPKNINWAILDIARMICRLNRPCCEICPLVRTCRYYIENKKFIGLPKPHHQNP